MNKNIFSRIGFSYLSMGIVAIIAQLLVMNILSNMHITSLNNNILTILSAICQYIIPIPLFYYLIRKIKVEKIKKHKLTIFQFLICIFITITLMYFGNSVGIVITEIIGFLKQNQVVNPIHEVITSSNIWVNLFLISIIGPIFEEIFFRKFLIDRTIKYGAPISIFLSALMFGLFHGNLNQFFYAFLLGGFFAVIYVRTGEIIYPIILHIITNLTGSVIAISVGNLITSLGNSPEAIIITLIYLIIIFLICLIGFIFIIKWRAKLLSLKNKIENPIKTSLLNIGMACFIGYCLIEIILTTLL